MLIYNILIIDQSIKVERLVLDSSFSVPSKVAVESIPNCYVNTLIKFNKPISYWEQKVCKNCYFEKMFLGCRRRLVPKVLDMVQAEGWDFSESNEIVLI